MPVLHTHGPATVTALLRMLGARPALTDGTGSCPGERESEAVHMANGMMGLAGYSSRTILERREMDAAMPPPILHTSPRVLIARRRAARHARAHFVGSENRARLIRTRRTMRRAQQASGSV